MRLLAACLALLLVAPSVAGVPIEVGEPVVMRAAAVSETADGFVGSTASITITAAANGTGHVFLDTFPLTEVDMQGSARLAARVASQVSGVALAEHDFFFVVRSGSEQIGGPSAGAAMTVGAIAALNGWKVRDDVLMTGTVNPDGTVGPVGGIPEKAAAAAQVGITRFLFPAGQEVQSVNNGSVDLAAYCGAQLGIECIPVRDVIEAVAFMTDHVIERPPIDANVTGEAFLAKLAPLGQELVDHASTRVDEASAAVGSLAEGAPKDALRARLEAASQTLARARSAASNGTYYTASSLSFQASIEARYVREAAGYVGATDAPAAMDAILARSAQTVENARRTIDAATVRDTSTFESVGAAQVRLMEAENRLQNARDLAAAPQTQADLDGAIHEASYAAERIETALWWLRLSDGSAPGQPVDADALEDAARDTITTSTEEVAYVTAVLLNANVPLQLLESSRALLETAQAAMTRGYTAGAMLQALEASVRASVILQTASFGGAIPESTFETARQEAARAIQGARSRGVESFLAQSAYEFGLSQEAPVERLAFLGVARVNGNLAGLPGLFGEMRPMESRFQGIPPTLGVTPYYVAAAFAVGIALGVGAGLAALMPRERKRDDETAPTQEPSQQPRSG